MIKKIFELETIKFDEKADDFVEATEEVTLRFKYTLFAIRAYEEATGSNWFDDLQKALKKLPMNGTEDTSEMVPLLSDKDINEFMLHALPAMYMHRDGNELVQNELTIESAYASDWLPELSNVMMLAELVKEFTSGMQGVQDKKPKKSAGKAKK